MTRFDSAPGFGARLATAPVTARSTIADHPAIFVVSLLLASLSICVVCGVLLVGQAAQYQVTRTIDAVQLLVFLQPHLGRSDAEGLKARIEASPHVAGATLRKREDALAAMTGGGLESLAVKPNPLPDVWIVSLALAKADTKDSLSSRVADSRAALASLPGVESVRVDSRWIGTLEQWSSWIGSGVYLSTWVASATLISGLFCLFFLAGRGYAASSLEVSSRVQALATVGMISGLASLLIAAGVIALTIQMVPNLAAVWARIVDPVGRGGHVYVVVMGGSGHRRFGNRERIGRMAAIAVRHGICELLLNRTIAFQASQTLALPYREC